MCEARHKVHVLPPSAAVFCVSPWNESLRRLIAILDQSASTHCHTGPVTLAYRSCMPVVVFVRHISMSSVYLANNIRFLRYVYCPRVCGQLRAVIFPRVFNGSLSNLLEA